MATWEVKRTIHIHHKIDADTKQEAIDIAKDKGEHDPDGLSYGQTVARRVD
jgi:hypothetical protein